MNDELPLKLISLNQTCFGCPSQWDAQTSDNRKVYIRYRWGYLSVRLGDIGDTSEFAGVRGKEVIGEDFGNELDGILSFEKLKDICGNRVEWPN